MNEKFVKDGYGVNIVHLGQYYAYQDSYYVYDVTPLEGQSVDEVMAFCQTLRSAVEKKTLTDSFSDAFKPYIKSFQKNGNAYRYEVCEPYCS